jgi:myo-inositol 2-dehydrogenase/D-chiro-inositol 1-dehydrogenase
MIETASHISRAVAVMNRPVRLAVIGAGRIGRVHATHLARRIAAADLVAVADVNVAAAQALAHDCGVSRVPDDYRTLLDDPTIDAIVICSSTDSHARIIGEAAGAGKHIFCEKPIDLDMARIDAALAAVQHAGVKLQIGFNRRFDANYGRVRQAVESGEIGAPHLLHIISRDPAPPPMDYIRVSGGMFMDMTIHDFDMARYLLGQEVEEVYAAAGTLVDPAIAGAGDVDTALVTLRFAGGALACIDNSRRAAYGYDQRAEVLGSLGSVGTANNYANTAIISTAAGIRRDLPLHFFLERYAESYCAEMMAFVKAVRCDTPPPVTGADGRMAAILALAAGKSHRERRPVRPVEITDPTCG